MKPGEFLTKLADQGVQVWVEKDRLRYRAPKGVLNSTILKELTENKQELLRFLAQESDQAEPVSLPQIEADPAQRYQPFPLTDLQLAEWIGQESTFEVGNVGNHVYIEIDAVDLDLQRMQSAVQRLIERHEMLRAILLPDGQQQILEHIPSFQIKVFDLRGEDPEAITSHLEQTRHFLDHQIIQVEQWPAFDLCVTLLGQRRSRLHLSIHFLFLDARSMGILIREFSMLYADPDTILAPLTLSFRDYTITWEHERDQSPAYQRAREYWLKRFPDLPPAPELPLATNPYALTQPRFVPYQNRLDAETWTRLKTRAARSGITPSVILLTAFAEVLATWSKSSRFSINLALSDRQPLHPQVDALVGNFSSFAPISFDFTYHETFENRARQVQEQVLDHLEYGQYSGMRMLKDLAKARGERDGAVLPIVFASAMIQDNLGLYSSAGPWKDLVYTAVQAPQVWLEHPVLEIHGNLLFSWQAVEKLFPKGLVADMFEAYCRLLEQLATQEDAWHDISRSLVPPAQLAQRAQLNQTEAPLSEELLHTLFVTQALRTPSATAVVTTTRRLTYQQVHQGASQLGRWLREQGAQPNRLVAIIMEKGWEQVVAALGILYAGAAYVPIDPGLPQERLVYSLENAQVDFILTQSFLDDKIVWERSHQRFLVDRLDLDRQEEEPFSCVQTPRDLAYVIYTSGSTGQPKGVMIEHQAAVNTILDMNERFEITAQDRLLSPSALHFDWSVYDIFGILAVGGTLVLPPEEGRRDPSSWLNLIKQEQVTVWTSVPALLQMLADYAEGSDDADGLRSLRLAFLGGDWIPLTLPGQIKKRAPEVEVISVGGATEASIVSIYYPIKQIEPEWKSIPYGWPLRNQRWHVLNERLDPCPTWVPGRLYIGGVGLARGYWRDEKKTQERFIHHPQTGERLYWTGDLGRYLPEGMIEFLGREDFQVKVQGHRIELGEIEEALSQHPEVKAAVATVSATSAQTEKRLIAYVVLHSQAGAKLENINTRLRQFLREKLPEYMVPATIVVLEALPLTVNDKVDRNNLPSPEAFLANDQEETFVSARTELEKAVVSIWQELLPSAQIGVHDNFFEVGGHSLLTVRLANRFFEVLHLKVPLQDLFGALTVADQAQLLETLRASQLKQPENWTDKYMPETDQLPQIVPDVQRRYDPYPLTDLQQAYWIGQTGLFELGNVFGHSYIEIEFAQLDLERLNQALQRLISHHDSLRCVILPDGQQQVLEVVPPYHLALTDLRELPEEDQQKQLLAIRERMCQQGPDTEHWPLWEGRVTLLGAQRLRLHFSHNLILLDARSMAILLKELIQLYRDAESALPALELTTRDYILALRQLEQSALYKQSMSYWQQRLATLPPAPQLPLLKQPGELKEAHFVSHLVMLDVEEWQHLKSLAVAHGLTPNAVLYMAYALVLATWSKTAHFTINMLFFNRFALHPQVDELVGNLSTTVLLEVDLREPGSFLSHAKRLQEQLWNDLAHSYVTGVHVIREVAKIQGWTSQAVMPVIFSSGLNMMNEEMKDMLPIRSEGQWELIYQAIQTPQVYLDHQVYEDKNNLLLKWDMIDELFAEGMPEEMLAAYSQLLHLLANDETTWQTQTRSLVPAEHLELYRQVNATEGPISSDLLHMPVLRQARQHPTQRAVVSAQRTLSYAEVARLATQIAHWLRQREVRPNTLVAVVMEKGWEQVVATLGVLEAGAAYLPLDPTLPQERLWYVLRDAQVQLVVTQSWVEARLAWPEGVERLCADSEEALEHLPSTPLAPLQQVEDLAYVIYTSGSTGTPKGVMIDHRGAINTVLDINERCKISSQDRVLALSALSFDLSVYDIFGTLSAGGVIVMPDAEASRDPTYWAQLLDQEQITVWNSVPAFMEMLVEYLGTRNERLASSLRLVMLSGDWIPVQLPDRIRALSYNPPQIMSLGGATEASIWSILYPIEKVQSDWKSIPYGRPMRNQHMYVLDENLQMRPIGVPGHLYIGGIGLAKGYWHDQAKTDASFIFHPHMQERLYRTGDLGRYLPDGTIEFLGREDLQVKVQGYRIELGEIEATLKQYAGVHEAIAAVGATSQGEKYLIAYIVPLAGQVIDLDALRAFARTKLPGYMVPLTMVPIETLPLTANGKVDRKALLAQHEGSSIVHKAFTPPRDALEQQLVNLWETILEQPSIGVTDSFFELGGNSLGALRLMGQIRQQFAQDLPLSLLFEGATIAYLAEILRERSKELVHRRSPLVEVQPHGSKLPFFCIHPVGGNVLCYAELARLLGDDQPFYALQSPGLEDDEFPELSIGEMAAYYREAIQTIQPEGPYLLGGWSMGGVVAFEIARQIRKERQEVALLMLLDSEVPSTFEGALDDAQLLAWFAKDLAGSSGKSLLITDKELRELKPEAQLTRVLEQARSAQILAPEMDAAFLRRLVRVFKANAQALAHYVPEEYPYPAVLLPTSETLDQYANDQTLGWDKVIGNALELYSLPGNHYTVLTQPHVQSLAEFLRQYIRKVVPESKASRGEALSQRSL